MENQIFDVRIVKSIKNNKHDVTKPQEIADVADFAPGRKYYHLSVMSGKQMVNGKTIRHQTAVQSITVFNSNDQLVLFNDITDAIEAEDYIVGGNGDLILKEFAIEGKIVEAALGFTYTPMTTDAKGILVPLMATKKDGKGNYIKEPARKSTVKFFVHAHEDEEVRFLKEKSRVERYKLTDLEPDDEDQTGSAAATDNVKAAA